MPQNFKLQIENGIFIKTFYGDDVKDTALIDLIPILIAIARGTGNDLRFELKKFKEIILNKISSSYHKKI